MSAITSTRLIPGTLKAALPLQGKALDSVTAGRAAVRQVLESPTVGSKLMVVVGPCSIHDIDAAMDYATRLAATAKKHQNELLIAMRVYIEKPRTTVGWKGLLHDPEIKQSEASDLDKGLYASRDIMIKVSELGLPVVTEMLSPFVMPFLEDVLSCGVIGARTTESQTHRELVSDVDLPVGFKNGTDGGLAVAIDAMKAASRPHTLFGVDDEGHLVQSLSRGNQDTFVVMRGGKAGPNFSEEHIKAADATLTKAGHPVRLVIDCSHGNSSKDYRNQGKVASSIAQQLLTGAPIVGCMIESNINAGRQNVPAEGPSCLQYGVSITDGCVDWAETERILDELATAVKQRNAPSIKVIEDYSVVEVAPTANPTDARRSSFVQLMDKFRGNIPTFEIA